MPPEFEQATIGMKAGGIEGPFRCIFLRVTMKRTLLAKRRTSAHHAEKVEWPHMPEIDAEFANVCR